MKVEIQFDPSGVAEKLQRFHDGLLPTVAGVMNDQNLLTAGHIQRFQLNFPKKGPTQEHGLRHLTGKLISSVITTPPEIIGPAVESAIGSAVVYAPVHEYGSTKKNIPARAPFETGLKARVPEYLTAISESLSNLWDAA